MLKRTVTSYLSDFVSLIYPNLCVGCETTLPTNSKFICPKCHYNLPKTNTHLLEVPQFKNKFQGIVPLDDILVYCYFSKKGIVQKLLQSLKYGDQPEIGEMLGLWYGHELAKGGYLNHFDLIVPVPLHKKRLQERGYNQSEFFARGLAIALHAELNTHEFIKARHIDSLTNKNKVNRINSVKGIFEVINKESFKDKRVLLVDDVLTTGSTLIACSEEILNCEPAALSVATIGGLK